MIRRHDIDAIFDPKARTAQDVDRRPLWRRFLSALTVNLKLRPNVKNPLKSLLIKGSFKF